MLLTLRVESIELVRQFDTTRDAVVERERVNLSIAPEAASFHGARLEFTLPPDAPNPFVINQRVAVDVDDQPAALPFRPPSPLPIWVPAGSETVPVAHKEDELEALDNMNADDKAWCADANDGVHCTRKRNHAGDHVSGFALDGNYDSVDTRWPNVPSPAPAERPADELEALEGVTCTRPWCGVNGGQYDLTCTRKPGHEGDHVAGFALGHENLNDGWRWLSIAPAASAEPEHDDIARFEHEGGPALTNRDLGDETGELTSIGFAATDITDDIQF